MTLKLYSVDGKTETLEVEHVCFGFVGVSYYVGDPLKDGHSEFIHYSKDNKHGLDYAEVCNE